ncbi:hypothetical protein LV75_006292 [Actinokineospora diospyrosa]|uniref:Uncharacterized protein n=1 Tax=Actinokineospora diospyrosa TaxID=103728 RepID=A0ABT1IM82_9PSEU|nr:hypothetical protein [Actinokineospora diospyrosa]
MQDSVFVERFSLNLIPMPRIKRLCMQLCVQHALVRSDDLQCGSHEMAAQPGTPCICSRAHSADSPFAAGCAQDS